MFPFANDTVSAALERVTNLVFPIFVSAPPSILAKSSKRPTVRLPLFPGKAVSGSSVLSTLIITSKLSKGLFVP